MEVNSAIVEEEGSIEAVNEEERRKLQSMRALIETKSQSAKEVEDFTLLRFLRARELDAEKASTMFLKYLKWRTSMFPNGAISERQIANEISQNKVFMQGVDKMNRPIVVAIASRHKPYKGSLKEFKRFVVFSLERISQRATSKDGKFCAIADVADWGYSSSDLRGYRAALSILQDYYPERLGKLFMVHVPYLFMTAWKLVYPFIDPITKKKIVFVDDKNLLLTLLDHIDEDQLPQIYGGKLPLVPIHQPNQY